MTVNGFGGMLQILIVKIGQEVLGNVDNLVTTIFGTLTKVMGIDSCRLAGLFITNGLLNALDR